MKQGQKNYYYVLSNSNYLKKKKQEPIPNLRNSPDTNANANVANTYQNIWHIYYFQPWT